MTDGSSEQDPSQPGQNPYGPPPTQPYPQGSAPPPYGQPYGQPYGPGQYGQQPGYYPQGQYYPTYGQPQQPQDSGAQAAMIVGIVSLALGMVACGLGLVGSPVAWYLGHQSKKRIDASGGQLGGRSNAQAGFVLGIIGTALLVLGILALIAFLVLIFGFTGGVSELDSDYGTAA